MNIKPVFGNGLKFGKLVFFSEAYRYFYGNDKPKKKPNKIDKNINFARTWCDMKSIKPCN